MATATTTNATRLNSRHAILDELRRRIVGGDYAAGHQFPVRTDLEREFDASSVTIQRAMDYLRREGFIEVSGRQGTYVVPHPPHLSHYALVFSGTPTGTAHWSRFYQALANEAAGVERNGRQRVDVHYGIEPHAENKRYHDLVRAMRNHLFAGLIFADHPYVVFHGTPLVDEPGIPRVGIMGAPRSDVAAVTFDSDSFLSQALDAFVSRGRRRLAVVSNPRDELFFEKLRAAAAARGMTQRPYWVQTVALNEPASARNCVHLLMHPGQAERPDALLISDDNLVEHASAGLVAAGVNVPDDLDVVAHCNFPWPAPSVLPVQRLGYDARAVLKACIASIDEQRQGRVPATAVIRAQFENELEEAVPAGSLSMGTFARAEKID
jgi:DNA-binding LacI/PurR family transcriptional regulator